MPIENRMIRVGAISTQGNTDLFDGPNHAINPPFRLLLSAGCACSVISLSIFSSLNNPSKCSLLPSRRCKACQVRGGPAVSPDRRVVGYFHSEGRRS